MAERQRHHHHDNQVAAERLLRPAADEMALNAVDPVNTGIDAFQGTATVVAALPGGTPPRRRRGDPTVRLSERNPHNPSVGRPPKSQGSMLCGEVTLVIHRLD